VTETIDLPSPPRRVSVDPDDRLFRRLAPGEAPPILRDVTLNPTTRLVVAAPDPHAARTLGNRLMDAGATEGDAADDGPLAIIGTAREVEAALGARGLPGTPAALAGKGTARVWTIRRDNGRTVLVVSADDNAALEALIRPLPHYGRQSYLIFQGREAVERGIWPAGENPLRRSIDLR
jgi:hypothetical protein